MQTQSIGARSNIRTSTGSQVRARQNARGMVIEQRVHARVSHALPSSSVANDTRERAERVPVPLTAGPS